MIQKAKYEHFGHLIKLDLFEWSERFGHGIAYRGSFKKQKNAFLNDPKGQKRGFWPFS